MADEEKQELEQETPEPDADVVDVPEGEEPEGEEYDGPEPDGEEPEPKASKGPLTPEEQSFKDRYYDNLEKQANAHQQPAGPAKTKEEMLFDYVKGDGELSLELSSAYADAGGDPKDPDYQRTVRRLMARAEKELTIEYRQSVSDGRAISADIRTQLSESGIKPGTPQFESSIQYMKSRNIDLNNPSALAGVHPVLIQTALDAVTAKYAGTRAVDLEKVKASQGKKHKLPKDTGLPASAPAPKTNANFKPRTTDDVMKAWEDGVYAGK